MQIRVRVSALKGTVAVSGKGSAFIVTDSKATARVFAAWLSRIGFLLVAAFAMVKPQINRTNGKIRLLAAQHGKQVFIKDGSVAISGMTIDSSEVLHSLEGPPWFVTQVVVNIASFTPTLIGLLDGWTGSVV
jgi:hypothetical protein